MPTRTPLVAALLLPLFLSAPVQADSITGRTVRTWIEDAKSIDGKTIERPPFHAGMLQGYLAGIADALSITRGFCPPKGLPYKALVEIVDKHLEHDYAGRDLPAAPRIAQLLRNQFPCGTPRPTRPRSGKEQDA